MESFDVLKNIQVAVTRDRLEDKTDGWHPSEKLTISEAVRMFTANNAYLAFEEHRRGSIEIGKDADMTVLERDIFQADPHEIGEIKISKTIVAGKEVYNG